MSLVLFRWSRAENRTYRPHELSVLVGAHRMYSTELWRRRHQVAQIIQHKQYSNSTMLYDVMLLRLTRRIKFSKKVRPICIDEDVKRPPGTPCVVTGWGTTSIDLARKCTTSYYHIISSGFAMAPPHP